MKVLIVEDEKSAAKRLLALLKGIDPDIEVIGTMDTVKGTAEWFRNNSAPDLLFLDIQLADGLSFDIFEQTVISCPVIFTTAYDQYALKAFEVYSIDYLLKPIDKEKLLRSLDKFNKIVEGSKSEASVDLGTLQNALEMMQGRKYKERFIVKYGEHIKSFPVENIVAFFSEEKISFFKNEDGRKYVVDYTIEQIEGLVDPDRFFRINRKYLINLNTIEDVIVYSNSRLKLQVRHLSDHDLVVAREKVQEFKKWLDR
jgi:DNA-binding LytR/AlgR family response regulator